MKKARVLLLVALLAVGGAAQAETVSMIGTDDVFNSAVDTMNESAAKVKVLETRASGFEERLDGVDERINGVDSRVTIVEWNSDDADRKINARIDDESEKLGGRIDENKSEIKNNSETIKALTGKVNTNDVAINKRVDIVSMELGDAHKLARDNFTLINKTEKDLSKKIGENKAGVETNRGLIDNLVPTVYKNDQLSEDNKEKLVSHDGRITANYEGIADINDRLDDAVYETVTTRSGDEKQLVKADVNREMIKNLRNEASIVNEDNSKKIEVNKTNITNNSTRIDNNSHAIAENSQRIDHVERKVNSLENEMNKGFAMSAAMSSMDFQSLDTGEMGLGIGVGNYQNAEAVSLGLGLKATNNLSVNLKGAMSTGKGQETMVGAGAVYKFRVFGS